MSDAVQYRAHDGLARVYRLERHLAKVVAAAPTAPVPSRDKTWCVQAKKEVKLALKLQPSDAMSHDILAKIYRSNGHSKQAAEQYAAALK